MYRAIDQFGQVIDVLVSEKRDLAATRWFFSRALRHGSRPTEVSTDHAPAYPWALDELLPTASHVREKYANNPIEADHGRLKSRLRPPEVPAAADAWPQTALLRASDQHGARVNRTAVDFTRITLFLWGNH